MSSIVLEYICPTLGAIMASIMFAAPVRDLRMALIDGSIGALNTFPFSFMCGNCLGWTVYGYYKEDPFVVAANVPGLILSIWLNSGASKLQYLALSEERKERNTRHVEGVHWNASSPMEGVNDDETLLNESELKSLEDSFVIVPQERALLRVLAIWTVVIVYVSWFARMEPANVIGVAVNINLIAFYGAPLQAMHKVIATQNSESIHVPTMIMNWLNTTFWVGYGFARRDPVIIIPNCLGFCLGLAQGVLRALYPSRPSRDMQPVPRNEEPNSGRAPPEEELPGGNDPSHAVNRRIISSRLD